jgi:hypothetical protein
MEPPPNHQKRMLQLTNEKMRNSSKEKSRCSLCWSFGHRATEAGIKCEVVSRYAAMLVDSKDVPDMAAGLGNPMLYEFKQPDDERKQMIKNWFEKIDSDGIPKNAQLLLLCHGKSDVSIQLC